MKHSPLLLLLAVALFGACNQTSDANRQLQDEMIAIHDEVMPMMGTFVRDIQKIDTILLNLDDYKTANPDLDTAQQRVELTELQNRLEKAHDSMNDWMHDLNLNFEGKSNDEIKAYLEVEKTKMEEIKQEFIDVSETTEQTLDIY